MFVKAAPGLKVPKENKPHDYIVDGVIEQIEESAYTLRRLSDGDLVEVGEKEYAAQQKAAAKKIATNPLPNPPPQAGEGANAGNVNT